MMTPGNVPTRTSLDVVKGALLFGVMGPLIGTIAVLAVVQIHLLMRKPSLAALGKLITDGVPLSFMLMIPGLFVAYVIGTVPAVATGAYAGLIRDRLDSRRRRVYVGLIGAALSLATFRGQWGALSKPLDVSLWLMPLSGFIAAYACACVLRVRWFVRVDQDPTSMNEAA